MPTTSRLFVKASLIYFGVGAVIGSLLLINRWVPLATPILALRASHIQVLIAGWLTQLIMGVGWWLFPPLALQRSPDAPRSIRRGQAQRGSEPLFWVTFGCLNAGILLEAIFAPLYSWTKVSAFSHVAGISDLFLLLAALSFVINIWNRVRALGRGV